MNRKQIEAELRIAEQAAASIRITNAHNPPKDAASRKYAEGIQREHDNRVLMLRRKLKLEAE